MAKHVRSLITKPDELALAPKLVIGTLAPKFVVVS
jgi:hypothetical protein